MPSAELRPAGVQVGDATCLFRTTSGWLFLEPDLKHELATWLDHLVRERLGVLPQQVDPNLPGVEAIRAIHQSTWNIADQINKLRNLQGTGHGRTLPSGVSEDLAMLVVREAATVADYMLARLDREKG